MNLIIQKSFHNSRFYRNYDTIDNILTNFKKIKNDYKWSKRIYKMNIMVFIDAMIKNELKPNILQNFIKKISKKIRNIVFFEKIRTI